MSRRLKERAEATTSTRLSPAEFWSRRGMAVNAPRNIPSDTLTIKLRPNGE